MQAYNVNVTLLRGRSMPRPSRKTLKNPMANHYECGDGKWLLLCEAQSDRFWHAFCSCLEIEHLENDSKFSNAKSRRDNFVELTELLGTIFKTKPRDEWIKILETKGEGMAFAPINDLSELSTDQQVLMNDYIIDIDHPTLGQVKMVGFPTRFSATPAQIRYCAPNFGQHTEEVLIEMFGFSWEELEKLREEEVI